HLLQDLVQALLEEVGGVGAGAGPGLAVPDHLQKPRQGDGPGSQGAFGRAPSPVGSSDASRPWVPSPPGLLGTGLPLLRWGREGLVEAAPRPGVAGAGALLGHPDQK